MNRCIRAIAAAVILTSASSGLSVAEDKATFTVQSLTLETALELAQATLKKCQAEGYQAAVSVVDRGGNLQVTLRDRFAGAHTPDTAYRKAWTALSFRTDTLELSELTEKGESWAIRGVTNALPIGGGVQIRHGDGSLLGAIGVSGAPGPKNDVVCAKAGLAAIEDKIAF